MASWEESELEELYNVVYENIYEINQCKVFDPNCEIIHIIHDSLPNTTRGTKALLYKFKEMKIIKAGQNFHKTHTGYLKPFQECDMLSFKISPAYKELSDLPMIEFKNCYESEVLKIDNLDQLYASMSDVLGLSILRIKYELYRLKFIQINALNKYELVVPKIQNKQKEDINIKQLSSDDKANINNIREDVSYIYNSHNKNNPSITYSNDGTGMGKSYGVFNSFIQKTDTNNINNGHRNLLFITPQKAQIDIDDSLVKLAGDKGIKILSFLARLDISNTEFKNWITHETNETLFLRWIKSLKNDNYFKGVIGQLHDSLKSAKFYNNEIPSLKFREEYELLDEYKERQEKNKQRLFKILQKLAQMILEHQKDGQYIPLNEHFTNAAFLKNNEPNKAQILSEIIDFVLPFERAKISPCILLATSDKFDYNVGIAIVGENGKPSIKSLPFDYIIGQKKKSENTDEEARTADVSGSTFVEQIDFIKHDYFLIDENSYFRKNNISFTLIVDEEHIAYDKFFQRSQKKLFDTHTQIAHVFSVVNRFVQSLKDADKIGIEHVILYEAKHKFVSELTTLFDTKCDVSKGITLNKVLNIFSNNVDHISIHSSELEQIISICKNVFSITPKRFFNEQGLKKIRIGSFANNTECRIYYENDTLDDNNPTMHDILQALMCVFAACSHIKDPDFRNMIRHGEGNSQNSLLDKFIQGATNARASIEAMFDRVDNDELYINEFFTYFTPKIVFSIEKILNLPFKASELKDKVYVSFRLDLFEALPEVTLMRALHNTTNSVICLSATSGFKNSYSGNYSRPVMSKFGEDSKNNLGYRTINRKEEDAEKLQKLRQLRSETRNVLIQEFMDTDTDKISASYENKDFQENYLWWVKSLRPYFDTQNPYKITELKRQIGAMLLAAYDKKNTLVLSLSNKFGIVLRSFIKSETGQRIKGLHMIDNDKQKIFEIKPFANGITLRIILFDASLVKDLTLEDYLKLQNIDTKIVFLSSYKSAGTGLNLFTHYENDGVDEDFERLVLINGPFYSNVLKETGLNSIENYVLLLKHYSDQNKSYQLKDFDVNLINGGNYKILMQEHAMSLLKDIMQAVGRIERRDTYMDTEIFLPSDVIDDLGLQFSRLQKEGNEIIFQSISLLNNKLMQFCLDRVSMHSFKCEQQQQKFSTEITKSSMAIEEFFKNYLNRRLKDAREGDKAAIILNEALRSIECITNPEEYINNLLLLPEIKEDAFLKNTVSRFYIRLEDDLKDITLCTIENDNKSLTDIATGDKLYQPYNMIIPKYNKAILHEKSTSSGILTEMFKLEKEVSKVLLPHPSLLPLFKGNIGEYMFLKCLETINVNSMTIDEIFIHLDPIAYELFDFYILQEDKIICIDVKNWSATFDKEELAIQTHEKALKKRDTLFKLADTKGFKTEFIYINTHHDRNAINIHQEFAEGDSIHYMNLFKIITQYDEVKKEKPDPKKKSSLKDRLNINVSLIRILKGSLNG